jgi:hypothetical protein
MWAKVKELQSSNSPSSIEQANRITNAVSSSIGTSNNIMNNLANSSFVPAQIDAANKWSVIAAVLNAVHAQMEGQGSAVAGYIAIAKELAVNLDQVQFAASVAQQYGLSGWFVVQ